MTYCISRRRYFIITSFFVVICVNILVILNKISSVADLAEQNLSDDLSQTNAVFSNSLDSFVYVPPTEARVLGIPRHTKGFLTIGIPTVQRQRGSYLIQTLESLIQYTSHNEKKEIVVVIFIADLDPATRQQMTQVIQNNYKKYINLGFIHLIQAPQRFYPSFDNLQHTFGDSEERVRWRSKQVVDYAFLYLYSRDLSEYYLQLEDDVVSSPHFVSAIKEFIESQKSPWVSLEFSQLGFIGKLFRSTQLTRLAKFVFTFYAQQPIDYLFRYFNVLMAQKSAIVRTPSLFQHVGVHSSLTNKLQKLQDQFFHSTPKKYKGNNPPATIVTNIATFQSFHPQLAYNSGPGYFWGRAPRSGDTLFIAFKKPVRLRRIVIETSSKEHRHDFLHYGKLDASPRVVSHPPDGRMVCVDYIYIGAFRQGQLDVSDLKFRIPFAIQCLRVTVTEDQQAWLLVSEIAVFVL